MTPIIRNKTYHKLTVMVTDEDEDGSISLSALQPQVGVGLTATLMDDDAADSDDTADGKQIEATWKWEQASAMSGPWTLISGATTTSYMPAADVVGMYLRATATYDDRHGDDKTAMATVGQCGAGGAVWHELRRPSSRLVPSLGTWTKTRLPAPPWATRSRLPTPLARH